jgi:hypothetical protein
MWRRTSPPSSLSTTPTARARADVVRASRCRGLDTPLGSEEGCIYPLFISPAPHVHTGYLNCLLITAGDRSDHNHSNRFTCMEAVMYVWRSQGGNWIHFLWELYLPAVYRCWPCEYRSTLEWCGLQCESSSELPICVTSYTDMVCANRGFNAHDVFFKRFCDSFCNHHILEYIWIKLIFNL